MAKPKNELLALHKRGHKRLYAVVINLGGFVHNKVYVLNRTKHGSMEYPGYWAAYGDQGFFVDQRPMKLGLNKLSKNYIIYLAKEKHDADLFLLGAMTAKNFMKEWLNG